MSDVENENPGSGESGGNTGSGGTGGAGTSNVSAKVRMGALQTTIRNVRQKVGGIFGKATGMSMQDFIDKGYAEANKAYDSKGQIVPN